MKRMMLFLLSLSLLFVGSSAVYAENETSALEVCVTGGMICGEMNEEGTVCVYKGIPYAAPPVGELRWKAPQPVTPWEGVLSCTQWSPSAPQPEQAPTGVWTKEFIIEDTGYSEDCLYLNVFSGTDGCKDKPVIVYIHGGAFTSGGASCAVYNGEAIAKKGVVFVSINYRLGILGYLAASALLSEDGHTGNYGLLDQIAALQWVKENIAAFGGDKDNVTVMGQSAGAASVNALLASPLAAGLFQKAVSMSFNSYTSEPWPSVEEAMAIGNAAFLGKTTEEMRSMDVKELLSVSLPIGLCVDHYALTDTYASLADADLLNPVVLMTGNALGDGSLIPGEVNSWMGARNKVKSLFGEYAETVTELYPFNRETLQDSKAALNGDWLAVSQLRQAAVRAAQGHTTYVYLFTHVMPGPDSERAGAFHTSDVPYFLNNLAEERAPYWTEADRFLANQMSDYLVNFAAIGDPNGAELPLWEEASEGAWMVLRNTPEATSFSEKKATFWSLYITQNIKGRK